MSYRFTDLTDACAIEWRAYTEHDFVRQLASGRLKDEAFRHYLKQDYLFLMHFGRAYALATYKSRDMAELRHGLEGLKTIIDVELELHIDYCREWGISENDLATLPEARATLAYTRYVLDTGNRGDLLDLHVALAPCLVGYGVIAQWQAKQPFTVRGATNPFEKWMQMYESDAFQSAMRDEITWLDARLADITPERFAQLTTTFCEATRLEIDFWQMGLDQAD
ncbi:thiaminase II [Halomonas halocynthiae]|uniref:thiaminase II n=1 Tax=Halomonas halocynthiae TaxID=176290 RepID=UPI00040919BB|nr:thiaminase II [Halomonas halocynthiae]